MVSEVKQIDQIQRTPVRIKFSKTGRLKYISHLDLNRTFQRIISRAKIPVWYTEGFNPIPKIVFSSPLSLGSESVCEFMDLKLVDDMGCDEIKEKLNGTMPMGLEVIDVYRPVRKFSEASFSEYEIELTAANVNELTTDELKKLFAEPIIILKRTKSGERETDILPFINRCRIEADIDSKRVKITAVLASDSEKYLNPEYIITAIKIKLDIFSGDIINENYSITRTNMYLSDGITEFL